MNIKTLTREQKIDKFFYILIGFVIFFTTSDLALGFTGKSISSAICSVISAILVFIGYFSIRKTNAEKNVIELTSFIKGNFDKWQILLSVLDVICSIIVVFTSIRAFGLLFRNVIFFKILFTPARITTLTNKFKTVTKPFLIFCFVWFFVRIKKIVKEYKMNNVKLSVAQKIAMVVAFVIGITWTILSVTVLPQLAVFDDVLAQISLSLGGTAGIVFGCFLKGKEMSEAEVAKRDEKLKLKETAYNEKVAKKEELAKEKEEKLKLAKAAALAAQRKKEAEEKAKADAEKAEIEALADKIASGEIIVEKTDVSK